ncbi:MAG: S8 family serine peptidase [Actinomycetota bacterium]|nr:S8 family serine peptidase [Actinomycetota bacterium]
MRPPGYISIVFAALVILTALCLSHAPVLAGPRPIDGTAALEESLSVPGSPPSHVPGEVMVSFREGVSRDEGMALIENAGAVDVLRELGPAGDKRTLLVGLAPGVDVEEAAGRLGTSPGVLAAEPNLVRNALYYPDDPEFGKQWGLHNTGQDIKGVEGTPGADIHAVQAWDIERGDGNPVTVAVLDSGIDFGHPDLDSVIWQNPGEIAGNQADDDGNGYVDDVNGYNFAGVSQTCFYYLSGGSPQYMFRSFGDGPTTLAYAQSLTGTGQQLTHVGILVDKVGSPQQPISVAVRAELEGPDLASFDISPAEVGVLMAKAYKELSSPLLLESGALYYLVFNTDNQDAANHYRIYGNRGALNGDIYDEGQEYGWDGSQWQGCPVDDLYFKTNPNPYPRDDYGHGTYVSGVIAAEDNDKGIAGISSGCRLMPLKVLDASGVPSGALNTAEIVEAIYYAADNGARVISMSLGSYWPSDIEQQAIDYAHLKGVVIVAAAGNDGDTTMIYPAACDNVMGVGATTNRDEKASFSNYNSSVDVTAPGKDVYSTYPSGGYGYGSGTSAATPHVAGLAALALSLQPSLSASQVEQAIMDGADDLGDAGRDDRFGFGRINALNTLCDLAGIPVPLPQDPPEENPDQPPVDETQSLYFAEGTCRDGFDSYICIYNPDSLEAEVTIEYMLGDGSGREQRILLTGESRTTIHVNVLLGEEDGQALDFSARLEAAAGAGIVAERAVYFTYGDGRCGGHAAVAAAATSDTWYFAEGYTGSCFDEWVCVLNPGDGEASLECAFQTQEEGEVRVDGLRVPARSRATYKVDDLLGEGYQASLELRSDRPVVAERVMYFDYGGRGGLSCRGGHCAMGATSLEKEHYFAEGCTRPGFEEWLTLQNPHPYPISVSGVYQLGQDKGGQVERTYELGASSRLTVFVADEVGEGKDVSAHLDSQQGFLAERPVYFDYSYAGLRARGGHCTTGAASSAGEWLLAEGYTGAGFDEWLCLQNAGEEDALVEILYRTQEQGALPAREVMVHAGTRISIRVNDHAGSDYQLSCRVSSSCPLVCERPMYFDFQGRDGGHDVVGWAP